MVHVVVLGGAFVGIQVAHRLLKSTRTTVKELKVTLVSKNSHWYWNLASVRAIVPGVLTEEQYNRPIESGFTKYPAEAFELVVGSVESADLQAKTIKVQTESGEREITYDHLVLGTGSRTRDNQVPWKANGTNEEILAMLRSTAEKVKAAKHIVVAGAGATGVETAGELRFEYKDKEVVLLADKDAILGGDTIASTAESELKKLGVVVKKGCRVAGSEDRPDDKIAVKLENGEEILTDLYLPTMGMVPNTEYLPETVLKENKFVAVDEFCRVKNAEHVWAGGDIVYEPRGSFLIADKQAAGIAKNIDLVLKSKAPTPVKLLPVDPFMCAVGRKRGAGRISGVKVPSIMAYMIKAKQLGLNAFPGQLDGSAF